MDRRGARAERMQRRYRVVDVFADRAFTGNPLSVVLDGVGLTAVQMGAIAREMNHSETTFVGATAPVDGAWPVRIFTPTMELPFAGHPTLGTAAVLHDLHGEDRIVLRLGVGDVPVRCEGGLFWMTQKAPTFGVQLPPDVVGGALGVDVADVDDAAPVWSVSTGLPFLLVPLRTREAVARAALDLARLARAAPQWTPAGVLVFAKASVLPGTALHARCFTQAYGIPEDPATGSAAGALAAWLSRTRYLGGPEVDVQVAQGVEMGRPSRLFLRAEGDHVEVGGRVSSVAEGRFVADPAV